MSSLILGKIKWFGPVYTFQDNSTLCGGIFHPKEEGRYHWTNQNSPIDRPMKIREKLFFVHTSYYAEFTEAVRLTV